MASHEGSESPPPAAWVWSHYRGVTTAGEVHGEASATAETPAARHAVLVGAGLATAVVVLTGLTWLFTNQPRREPAPPPASLERVEAPAPAVEAPKPAEAPAPAPAAEAAPPAPAPAPQGTEPAQEAPKATPAPAPGPGHMKKMKKHRR